jgi:excisionase family DNA binding protein
VTSFLTTKQLQEILQIDRTTIYRMAETGRLPALKVGNQWRFPKQRIEAWLKMQSPAGTAREANIERRLSPPSSAIEELRELLPIECVQRIQDTFADALGVMVLVTDLSGQLVTTPSNACGFFEALHSSKKLENYCFQFLGELAKSPDLAPRFIQNELGLLCARGLIQIHGRLRAMVVVGGIAPSSWPPSDDEVARLAREFEVDPEDITSHINEVYCITAEKQAHLLSLVQRIADVISHIGNERYELFSKLQRIAELTRV